ncbi:conserved hypothetical protein, partial [Ricinus communis]
VGGHVFNVLDLEVVAHAGAGVDLVLAPFQHQPHAAAVEEHQVAKAEQLGQAERLAIKLLAAVGAGDG